MHDKSRIRHLLRRHLLEIGTEAGDGSWEEQKEEEYTPDGKAVLTISIRPASHPRPAAPGVSGEAPRGRTGEVAKAILRYLRSHPESPHADILAAMEEEGYSATATNDNLRVLRNLGLISQPAKGLPYSVSDEPEADSV